MTSVFRSVIIPGIKISIHYCKYFAKLCNTIMTPITMSHYILQDTDIVALKGAIKVIVASYNKYF